MRYYLDTNILIFILLNENDEIDKHVVDILNDYSNTFYVSPIAVKELLHLYKTGDIKDNYYKSAGYLLQAIENYGIEIKPLNKYHLAAYARLGILKGHKDPNDHVIIAQAITDKISLISSDTKFKSYTAQGLQFIFNKR
ncbi:MAG: type II toxin-antitoxin system VapC family toxin [Dysgonamonadaceae bacterium]|jgi:PIN domain nuclease of toxin-antitoxin system|nr:type II toxin-antitoxin system VapC family toxin [Dysgonamonadaceae bacterium]